MELSLVRPQVLKCLEGQGFKITDPGKTSGGFEDAWDEATGQAVVVRNGSDSLPPFCIKNDSESLCFYTNYFEAEAARKQRKDYLNYLNEINRNLWVSSVYSAARRCYCLANYLHSYDEAVFGKWFVGFRIDLTTPFADGLISQTKQYLLGNALED